MKVELTLTPEEAAGLCRFADKVSREMTLAVLYAHLPDALRDEQAFHIVDAFRKLEEALGNAGVRTWPWLETGRAQ